MSKFRIPQPCHQDWNKMTPDEKGRYCEACNKSVNDFTHMKEEEIESVLKNANSGVCGRFTNLQLGKPNIVELNVKQKSKARKLLEHSLFTIAGLSVTQKILAQKTDTLLQDYKVEEDSLSRKVKVVAGMMRDGVVFKGDSTLSIYREEKLIASVGSVNGIFSSYIELDSLGNSSITLVVSEKGIELFRCDSFHIRSDSSVVKLWFNEIYTTGGPVPWVSDEGLLVESRVITVTNGWTNLMTLGDVSCERIPPENSFDTTYLMNLRAHRMERAQKEAEQRPGKPYSEEEPLNFMASEIITFRKAVHPFRSKRMFNHS